MDDYDVGVTELESDDYDDTLFQTLYSYVKRGFPGFSQDDYKLVLKNQAISRDYLKKFEGIGQEDVYNNPVIQSYRVFPCLYSYLLPEMRIRYYDT